MKQDTPPTPSEQGFGSSSAAPTPSGKSLARTVGASVIGTIAEYYDFFIYGTASALVFNKIFFPEVNPLVGTLAAFGTYAVGFLARPLGGIVWGYVGDRIGRKRTLVFTLLLTGLGTFAVGLMPTYQEIGIWATVILVLVRLIQGFGVGGEQGGAVLLTAEASPPLRRGFYASMVQLGAPVAYLIPTALFAVLTGTLSSAAFESWGWRVPFLLSLIVVIVGLYIRLRVPESTTFEQAKQEHAHKHESTPIKVLWTNHRLELVGGFFAKFVETVAFPLYTIFLVAYAKNIGVDSSIVLDAVIIAILCELVMIPLFGRLSDKVGRKPVYLGAALLNIILIVPAFLAVETGNVVVITLLMIAGLALAHAGTYAPQSSFFAELFPAYARYSGVSIVWQFGAMVASGPFTVIGAALLVAAGGSFVWVAVYLALLFGCSVVALLKLPETAPAKRQFTEYTDWAIPVVPEIAGPKR
jgi:MFS transporter, MHS family, shikimate and dehydroshikimate transport protein